MRRWRPPLGERRGRRPPRQEVESAADGRPLPGQSRFAARCRARALAFAGRRPPCRGLPHRGRGGAPSRGRLLQRSTVADLQLLKLQVRRLKDRGFDAIREEEGCRSRRRDPADQVREPLAAVVAERGIELKKKGHQLEHRAPSQGEDGELQRLFVEGLYDCFGCGASGHVTALSRKTTRSASGALSRRSLGERASISAAHGGAAVDRTETPVAALTPPPGMRHATTARKAQAESALLHGSPQQPSAVELLPCVIDHYHRTFCEREDARRIEERDHRRDPWKADGIGYADGSLLKTIRRRARSRTSCSPLASSRRKAASSWAAASWCRSRTP